MAIVHDRIRPKRSITGMSAILLPFAPGAAIDWDGFGRHLERTVAAGLVPAVNMDTGFGPVLTPLERRKALTIAQRLAPSGFVAGAHVADGPGARLDRDEYRREFDAIAQHGGTPIMFPSYGLAAANEHDLVDVHEHLARDVDRMLGFELGAMFHPAGRIFSLDTFRALLALPKLAGLKHSSLDRTQEWARLAVRDEIRPDFLLLTGNDLAIDMVIYGSDYLLGLSTFAPDAFAMRDAAWAAGDEARFWAINDVLQYLGRLTFRAPVPAYRHSAATFLALRGWIACDRTHPLSPNRPESDRAILADVLDQLTAALTTIG